MATLQQLKQLRNNANVKKFLDLLAYTEGTTGNGYYTAFGGGRLAHLNDHPRYSKKFKQTDGKTNTTSAAGRYQFLRRTWDGLAKKYGFRDFGAENQDLGAIALLIQNGAMPHILKGNWGQAVAKSGGTWASLPSSPHPQPTKSWKKVQAFLGGKIAIPQANGGRTSQPKPTLKPLGNNWNEFVRQQTPTLKPLGNNWQEFVKQNQQPILTPLGDNWSEFVAQHQGQSANQAGMASQEMAQPQSYGTFDAIKGRLSEMATQGINPYQAIYTLAQGDDDIGKSIQEAYRRGMNSEQLTDYFGVNTLWQAEANEKSQPISTAKNELENPTMKSFGL